MSIKCDVFLQWTATPDQLTALGAALWRWCIRAAADTGIYQYLDNQMKEGRRLKREMSSKVRPFLERHQ